MNYEFIFSNCVFTHISDDDRKLTFNYAHRKCPILSWISIAQTMNHDIHDAF